MDTIDNGRHPINIGHLVMGLAFLGLVMVWAVIQSNLVEGADVRWLLPLPWVFAGAAGLLATTLAARRRGATQTGWEGAWAGRSQTGWEGAWAGSSATGWVDTESTEAPTAATPGHDVDEER